MRTEVVYPQDRHEVQATFIADHERFDGGRSFAIPVAVEFGITDAWQIGVSGLPYSRVALNGAETASGRGGLAVGTKYSFMNIHGSPVHAAVGVEAEFQHGPAVENAQNESGHEVETFGVVAVDLRSHMTAFAHAGVIGARTAVDEGEPNGRLSWTMGALIAGHRATLATELNFINNRGFRRGTGGTYVTPSLTVHPREAWELAVGVPVGLTSRSNTVGLIGHVIYER
jgi:hypothetical protein